MIHLADMVLLLRQTILLVGMAPQLLLRHRTILLVDTVPLTPVQSIQVKLHHSLPNLLRTIPLHRMEPRPHQLLALTLGVNLVLIPTWERLSLRSSRISNIRSMRPSSHPSSMRPSSHLSSMRPSSHPNNSHHLLLTRSLSLPQVRLLAPVQSFLLKRHSSNTHHRSNKHHHLLMMICGATWALMHPRLRAHQ
jgi:hypothetical protein